MRQLVLSFGTAPAVTKSKTCPKALLALDNGRLFKLKVKDQTFLKHHAGIKNPKLQRKISWVETIKDPNPLKPLKKIINCNDQISFCQ